MASFQKTLNVDSLTVVNINARSGNNSNIPAFRVLTTDGLGGTMWMTLSSLKDGGAFHSFITTPATYMADTSGASFSILDGPNAGLINDPTAPNTAYLYAKAFGQFDISGGNSIVAFDTVNNKVNSNVKFVGTGGINIRGDPQKNTMFFDGRELPFISTVPYSFSKYVIYSNVPYNTSVASTFSSIILQANGPSSLLSFVGIDPLVIYTDYQTNQIKISLSSLNAERISTILNQQTFLISTSITKTDLSSFSSAVGQPINIEALQGVASSLSTGLTRRILLYSTTIGNVKDYSRGISTVWRASEKNTFLLSLSTATLAQSTNVSVEADITNLYNLIQTDYNVLRGSTIETPYFWASTLVTPLSSNYSAIATPNPNVDNINITVYPIYSSFYNIFNDTQTFGSPVKPTIYPTEMIIDRNNRTSNVSSLDGIVFSNNYALRGSFIFYPEDDTRTFYVNYKGILSLNVFGQQYGPVIPEYPRMELFTNTVSTVTDTIPGFAPVTVHFTFLKLNSTDYISFSNFYDVLDGTQSFDVAPIYPASGYNMSDEPLYERTLEGKFPIGFSTISLLDVSGTPFQALSTYVLVLNTTYNSGCNTIFPFSTSGGFTSMSFHETTSGKDANGYIQDLSRGISSVLLSSFSASNAFGYTFKDNIPSTSYTLNLVYGRSKPTENLLISSLVRAVDNFDKAYSVYYSSFMYGSSISSYNGYFVNLNANTLNLNNLNLSTLYLSSLLHTSNVSSYNGNFVNLFAQYFTISTLEISTTIQSYTFNTSSLTVSSINGIALPFPTNSGSGSSSSSISTFLGNLINLNSSLSTNISTFNSPFSTFIYDAISSFSTAMGRVGTGSGNGNITYEEVTSTISTFSTAIGEIGTGTGNITYEEVTSTISTFSTSLGEIVGGGGTGDASSTISTFITYVTQLASTIGGDNSTISTGIATSLTTSIQELASTIDGNLMNYTPNNYLAELHTSTLHTSSIITSGLRQPFIQYGKAFAPTTEPYIIVTLPVSYVNANYTIQITVQTDNTTAYCHTNILSNAFKIVFTTTTVMTNVTFMWTTFGDIF